MKPSRLFLGLALLPFSTLSAQAPGYFGTSGGQRPSDTPSAAGTPATSSPVPVLLPHPRILTEDDFRAFLTGTTWQWRGPGLNKPYTLTFYADGTARNSGGWTAKSVVKNIAEIQLQMGKDIAKMTFDPTYTHFDGIDFDKKRPLQGQREK